MNREMTKEEAYDMVQNAIKQCTVEESHHMAVVVVVNTDTQSVKVYGLNIDESDVPMLLVEAAGEVGQKYLDQMKTRTIQ